MATVAAAPGLPRPPFHLDSESLSTIRDPRSPSNDHNMSKQGSAESSPHPDLNVEVASLSNKLISAINHQTHLDDALAAARQELEATRENASKLRVKNHEHEALLKSGQLVRKEEYEFQVNRLTSKLVEERKQRASVEREKKDIEQELENLTTALFEEANEMVAAARKEREASERCNEQLRTQLKETESLLISHQEQLAELKEVISQIHQTTDENDQMVNMSTAPSTPALPSQREVNKTIDTLQVASNTTLDDVPPAPPTSFSNLISPVLRTNLPSFEDFKSLLEIPKKSAPSSRVSSGSYGGVSIPGLASSSSTSAQTTTALFQGNNAAHSFYYNTTSPSYTPSPTAAPLKETRFYKRALAEDIEPTLRLDTAPGLSWLARRTVVSSICEGTLVVEPMPASTRMAVLSCSLCGEYKKGPEFTRTHRFRTSESENAQRYPLCTYCLKRVRATCDYLGFLRMIKDGHWRADTEEAEKSAWEESVRLRERMFWARIGGGVVPAFFQRDSPGASLGDSKPSTPVSAPPTVYRNSASRIAGFPRDQPDIISQSGGQSSEKQQIDRNESHAIVDESAQLSHRLKFSEPQDNDSVNVGRGHRESVKQSQLNVLSLGLVEHSTSRPSSSLGESNTDKATNSPTPEPVDSKSGLQIDIPGGFDF